MSAVDRSPRHLSGPQAELKRPVEYFLAIVEIADADMSVADRHGNQEDRFSGLRGIRRIGFRIRCLCLDQRNDL